MSGNIYGRSIRRTIFGSMGRYIAILAIIALGVGFFAGVKDTKDSMMLTCDKYVSEYRLYDFRLLSTYGFTDEDIEAIAGEKLVAAAEGSITTDFFSEDSGGNSIILRAHSLTENVNKLDLQAGRMPESADECVADSHFYTEKDIGRTIKVTDENSQDSKDALSSGEYKITGLVNSPYYLMIEERGTTSLGNGKIDAYIYAPREAFTSEYYTEAFVTSEKQGFVFSDEYYANMKKTEPAVKKAAQKRMKIRHDDIVADAQAEIDSGQKELDDGKAELQNQKESTYAQLEQAKKTLDEKSSQVKSGKAQLESQKSTLTAQRQQASAGAEQIRQQIEALDPETSSEVIENLNAQLTQLEASITQIDAGLAQISTEEKNLESAQSQIDSGYSEYKTNKAKADSEFASAEKELEDGAAQLDKARSELKDLDEPEIYVQDREDNTGFGSYESNADIVDSVAKVFPVFFFLIAALVCSTTMTRMIDEERTQIGALSAMGYTSGRIILKYMVYSGSAAVIGCTAGFLAGSKYFPYFIWVAYGMMFGFAPLEFYFNWKLAVISLIVSLLCSTGTTYLACRGQLTHMPAEILRPKAPKSGKRIFLERAGFIWKRLSFLHKVTARNIFRYKKRMIMMIVGIGGCTSLVLAGFGINDSVAGIADDQYTQIEKYNITVAFEDPGQENKERFEEEFSAKVANSALLQQISTEVQGPEATKTCSLMITDDREITKAVNFTGDGKTLRYPGKGEAMINNKLADMLGVEEGDKIQINYDDTHTTELTVSGVYRNYVSNYIYISSETYEENMGKTYEPSMLFVTLKDGVSVQKTAEKINSFDGVIGISANEDVQKRVDDMMVSLDYIIILVIGCAGALAFIVLFNLGNINITEREREIATIEVLGFYPREMGAYVFRENFILVLMGIVVGLPAGYALHKFIMKHIIVDAVSFNEIVEPLSYLWTVLVVLGFSIIVDLILRRKLRRINMAESLKSVE